MAGEEALSGGNTTVVHRVGDTAHWHFEYGVRADEYVEERQCRNLAALLDGYQPSAVQRRALGAAIGEQMVRHASDLEDMAQDDPAFAVLVERGYARATFRLLAK